MAVCPNNERRLTSAWREPLVGRLSAFNVFRSRSLTLDVGPFYTFSQFMSTSLDPIGDKLQAWLRCWGAVVITPWKFFRARRQPYPISAFHFFVGNQLLAYLLLFSVSIGFFLLYYPERLFHHTATSDLPKGLTFATACFAAFVLLSFVFVFVSSIITLLVARGFRSSASITSHVNSFLHLSAIEPIAMVGFGIVILAADPRNTHSITPALVYTGLTVWALARIWSFVAGFFALSHIHSLPLGRRVCLYILGFIPGYVVLQSCIAVFLYLLIALVFIPIGD
jgi:hypothetical protein